MKPMKPVLFEGPQSGPASSPLPPRDTQKSSYLYKGLLSSCFISSMVQKYPSPNGHPERGEMREVLWILADAPDSWGQPQMTALAFLNACILSVPAFPRFTHFGAGWDVSWRWMSWRVSDVNLTPTSYPRCVMKHIGLQSSAASGRVKGIKSNSTVGQGSLGLSRRQVSAPKQAVLKLFAKWPCHLYRQVSVCWGHTRGKPKHVHSVHFL